MKAGVLIGYLKDEANEDLIIRTAEALGVNHVFSIGEEREYNMSSGAEEHVSFFYFESVDEFFTYADGNNFNLVCVENNVDGAEALNELEKYPVNPVFVTGHENVGVPGELLENSDYVISLTQGMGYVPCLNTAVACSIIMHDWFRNTILD